VANDPSSLRTELAKVRFFGSARSGTHDSWTMRLTSAALIPLTIAFVWLLLTLVGKDYNAVRAELGAPFPSILMLLFVLASIYHMALGMRSIILDYVHDPRLREWSLVANVCFSVCVGLACVYAILRIGFA
jgi:succinate dehydrogenase / fumarate reductase membrane anchor subunit